MLRLSEISFFPYNRYNIKLCDKKGFVVIMFIVPISELPSVLPTSESNKVSASTTAGSRFENVLKSAMENLNDVQNTSDKDSIDLALGRSDDLHSIQINTMKATAAIELTASVTSKVLSAYKEIIGMQL